MDGRHIFKNGLKTARLGSTIFVQFLLDVVNKVIPD